MIVSEIQIRRELLELDDFQFYAPYLVLEQALELWLVKCAVHE